MNKRVLMAASLWLTAAVSWGQFINQNNPNTVYYSSSNSYGNDYNLRSAMNQISEGQNGSRSVGYNFTERIRVYNQGSNRIEARVAIVGLQTQPVQYRGFDFTKEFTPASAKVDIELWRNGQRLKKCTHYPKNFSGRDAGEFTCDYQDTASYTSYEVRLVDLDFQMSSNIQTKVRERVEMVEDYYKSADLSNKWQRLINSVITNNPDVDSLDRYEDRLEEVRKEIDGWKRKDFWQGLGVEYVSAGEFDPLRVEYIKKEVEKLYEDKNNEFKKLDISQLYAEKSRLYFLRDELFKSREYANKSINKSSNNPAGRLMLAKVAIKKDKDWKEAAKQYGIGCGYTSRLSDKPEWSNDFARTGEQISGHWQQQAQEWLQKGDFEQAEESGQSWEGFCRQSSNCVKCSSADIEQLYRNIGQRWQESLLTKARSLRQTGKTNHDGKRYEAALGNYDEAWAKLKECQTIASRYSNYVKATDTDPEQNQLLDDYYQSTAAWAEQMYSRNELKKSLDLIKKAKALTQTYGVLSKYAADCAALEKKVQRKNFDIHNELASQAEANGDYAEALARWEAALLLDSQFDFYQAQQRADIQEKNRNIAKTDIIQRVQRASDNPLETNENLYNLWETLSKQAKKYQISNDTETKAAIERLRTELCTRVETFELEPLRKLIKASNKNRDFIQAASKLSQYETIAVSYQPALCSFDDSYINEVKEEIRQCGVFQTQLKAAQALEETKSYRLALAAYEEANVSYRHALVQKNFPDYPQHNLLQYVLAGKNSDYLLAAAQHQHGKAAHDDAILLLQEAFNNGISTTATEELQKALATAKAQQLYVRKKSWKKGLAEALKGKEKDKRWKTFRKAFRKSWG